MAAGLPRSGVVTPAPDSASGGRAGRLKPDHFPLGLSPHDAWRQPILRLADTLIGVTVGLVAAWLGLRAVRPLIRKQAAQTLGENAP
jgi:hypothetical protein